MQVETPFEAPRETPPAAAADISDAPPAAAQQAQAAAPEPQAADTAALPPADPASADPLPSGSTGEAGRRAATLSPEACAAELKRRFPALFSGAAKPLKLRIQADIQAAAPGVFTKQALSAFLRRHTGSTSYLIAMTKAHERFDLEGQPAGEVTEEHRNAALEELARRRANHQSKANEAEEARRRRAALLHDFETTTLTPANFCTLKGVAPQALDALLATARREAQERRERPQGPDRRPPPRHDRPRRPPR